MKNKIYTRNEAAEIVGLFEDLLDANGIKVKSPDDDERAADNDAPLYGRTYYDLLDDVEGALADLLSRHNEKTEIVMDEFSEDIDDIEWTVESLSEEEIEK